MDAGRPLGRAGRLSVQLRIRWRSLRTKIIAWSFVPTAVILLAVALLTFTAYQRVTEDLVIERDQELTRLAASQLATEVTEYANVLAALARSPATSGHPAIQQAALRQSSDRLAVFDGGVLILDTFGTVIASEPERPEIRGQSWANRAYFHRMIRDPGPVFSDMVADGPQGAPVIVVAVPILGSQEEFLGTMVGMFRVGANTVSALYGDIVKLRLGKSGQAYLVDGSGRVVYHSNTDYIGQDFSGQAVVQQVLDGRVGALRTRDPDGRDIVAGFAPVPGTGWGLITEESWSTLLSSGQDYRRFLFVLLALGVAAPVAVVAVGVRRITRPIKELIEAAQAVAGGDFGQTITARTGDEVEELAQQFNLMSAQLQESYAHLERRVAVRTKELAALNAIAGVVSRSLHLEDILKSALEKTLEVMEIEAGGIYLLDEKEKVLNLAARYGFDPEFSAEIDGLHVGEGFSGRVVETGQPLVVSDVAADPRLTRLAVGQEGLRSLVSVPLSSKGKVLGALFAITHTYREFSEQDVQLFTSIGQQIGVAVDNARLYEQAQQVATLEERQRLARELHDSVTQELYGITMYAEATARLLAANETGLAAEHLRDLRDTAQEALREMRLLIFELRPPLLDREGLIAALEARLETVEGRSGLQTEFHVEGIDRLPLPLEEGLYRIAQEALNNALRHAQARCIRVCLCGHADRIALEVADDGVGFDPATAQEGGGLGLAGMRERTDRLGGRLTLTSRPGQGTQVKVEVNL
jgi:signal transduction histidine kinase